MMTSITPQRVPVSKLPKLKLVNCPVFGVKSEVSETTTVRKLAAALEKLKMEKKTALQTRLMFYGEDKLAISLEAFKEATCERITNIVNKADELRLSFDQYIENLNELCNAVSDEHDKRLSEEATKLLFECSNEQEEPKGSEDTENTDDTESTDDRESTENRESTESTENAETSKDSKCPNSNKELYHVCFDIDIYGIHDFKKLHDLARYCRKLSICLLLIKGKYDQLPSNFSYSKFIYWRTIFTNYLDKIELHPAYLKLLSPKASSEKLQIYLKSCFKLVSNFVSNMCMDPKTMNKRRKQIENFASTSEAMGTFLQRLYEPMSRIALIVKDSPKNETYYEDSIKECLNEIFNLARYFKTLLHGDLPYYDDLVKWAYDLREYAFEICLCSPCYFSVL